MKSVSPSVLTVNGGSSSLRFAIYEVGEPPRRRLAGKIDRIGLNGTNLTAHDQAGQRVVTRLTASDHRAAVDFHLDRLEAQPVFATLAAAGHRVVHGMKNSEPEWVTPRLLAEPHRTTPYAPDHLPREISLIETIRKRHPKLPHVACLDTAFHRDMPPVAQLLPIPRRYAAKGVERFGFHGLSYADLMEELGRLHPSAATGRVVLAHLGSGASLAAVRAGKSIDTSMGFEPTAGLVMGTRTGDLDAGLIYYLARTERSTAARFQRMVNHESGLLGVSGISSDIRDVLAHEAGDVHAANAIALFCYQAKRWTGSFAAALGDWTRSFSPEVGENAPPVRPRICEGLNFLGIELHKARNSKSEGAISKDALQVTVRVIHTDEELMIARSVCRSFRLGGASS